MIKNIENLDLNDSNNSNVRLSRQVNDFDRGGDPALGHISPETANASTLEVGSWDEWSELETVIVGSSINAQVPPSDISLRSINYANDKNKAQTLTGRYPEKVVHETEEDLSIFCQELTRIGVNVIRPKVSELPQKFSTPHWSAESYYGYCPRDSVLIHGNKIIETPMPLRSRYFENEIYRETFMSALRGGAQWFSAPKPQLKDDAYYAGPINRNQLTLNECEPCFDAANILRCGRDLFYLVSNSGNKMGARWLQNILGDEFNIHLLEGIYSFMHIDSTISFIRPGLVLLNPERIKPESVPTPLRDWDKIWCPEPVDIGYFENYNHASTWIGMNLFMIRPDLAVVEKNQTALIKEIERHGVNVLALNLRHARTLGGCFHCVTLDVKRKGKLESYFS